jgi:neutral ceramidase
VILAVPGEMTTIAARRLKAHVRKLLGLPASSPIALAGYANAYMGYVTTPEEYSVQCYEGGHTIYGVRTLAAIERSFSFLCEERRSGQRSPEMLEECFHFPEDELSLRSSD